MNEATVLLTLGGLLRAGLAMDEIGRRTHLPRVTLLPLCGIAAGPSLPDVLPVEARSWYRRRDGGISWGGGLLEEILKAPRTAGGGGQRWSLRRFPIQGRGMNPMDPSGAFFMW